LLVEAASSEAEQQRGGPFDAGVLVPDHDVGQDGDDFAQVPDQRERRRRNHCPGEAMSRVALVDISALPPKERGSEG